MWNSLYTGVTGLRINQEMLDVVGNNLANSNTTGFKSQRVRFSDLIYQTISHASSASTSVGGTNPIQTGLGARVAAIDANLAQGSLESTGRDLDVAINGSGYFVARNGSVNVYTRAGAFGVDSENYLVDPSNGYRVQRFGNVGEASPTSPAFQVPGNDDIRIPLGVTIPGNATSLINLQGNLSANAVGPLAQVLSSVQPLRAGSAAATTSTLLSSLNDNLTPYAAGDQLVLQGTDTLNAPVNASLAVGPTTTVGDLINAINANFPGSTASLDASGNLVVRADSTGVTGLSLNISDGVGNAGTSKWNGLNPTITTTGKEGDTVKSGIQVYDAQGTSHNMTFVFQKQGNNLWNLTAQVSGSEGTMVDGLVGNIRFNEDGSFQQVNGSGAGNPSITVQFNGFSSPQVINFDFGKASDFNGLTQTGSSTSSAAATGQDGLSAGYLTSVTIDHNGIINGVFTNGRTLPLGQIAIASFANPAALNRVGDNYFAITSESGPPLIGAAVSGERGSIQQKVLESSNVEISFEFTRLIVAQRGFQVNARVITASDQMLQELANVIR